MTYVSAAQFISVSWPVVSERTGSSVYFISVHCAKCTNGGDTQSRNLYKKLDRLTWFLVQDFSCTSFLHRIQHISIPYKKLACTWLEWWAL